MKMFLFIFVATLFTLNAQNKDGEVIDFVTVDSTFYSNLSFGMTRAINDITLESSYGVDPENLLFQQLFYDQNFWGYNVNMSLSYVFSQNYRYSNELVFGFGIDHIVGNKERTNKYLILIDGEPTMGSLHEEFYLRILYFNIDLLYKFNFGKKHIGFYLGPSLSVIAENKYRYESESEHDFQNQVSDASGSLKYLEDNQFMFLIGLNYTYYFKNIGVFPYFNYYINKRQFYKDGFWDQQIFKFGVGIRAAFS